MFLLLMSIIWWSSCSLLQDNDLLSDTASAQRLGSALVQVKKDFSGKVQGNIVASLLMPLIRHLYLLHW